MNQITRCPNCSTSFRVTDDQLAAHQGKVRCGRCSFIFNARDFLQRVEAEQSNTSKGITPQTKTEKTPQAIPQASTITIQKQEVEAVIDAASKVVEQTALNTATPTPAPPPIEPAFPVFEETAKPKAAEPAKDEKELKRALARLIKQTRKEKTQKTRKPSRHTIAAPEVLDIDTQEQIQSALDAVPDTTFESNAEYRPILDDTDDLFLPPKRSAWYWLWSVASLVLTLTLLAQLAYNFRLELSQEFPALRPKWEALCTKLQCDMPLPRESELLRSEWSELTYIPDHPTLIQVKATLRNLAPFDQALPKLELTLTDENERVLAKKVFLPKEYLAQDATTQSSLRANDELHAFLQLDLGPLNSTGYSLYWYYD
ncbi:DUF3426 domain-containing protein [Chitinibacter sp. SCUT-21]|uniref:DUF3426 domain-containing protein n=1 Tax=Chitinibacter sp. SCUT-21 TaxID=2970891 RepID=UPI0035A577B9